MSEHPRISVVIDNYNYGQFLAEAIESALEQTYPAVEVVVVDDGSTDESRQVIAAFGRAVQPVLKRNGGQASAVNAGFRVCSGDLVLFLDADDLLRARALERIAANQVAGMSKLHFRLEAVDAEGRPLGYTVPSADRPLAHGDALASLLAIGRYVTPTMSGNVFPRAVLERILPVPEHDFRISADGYLVTVAPLHGPVVAVDELLGAYRVHGANWWAPATIDGARLRGFVTHDFAKHRSLRVRASAAGLTVGDELLLRDQFHVRARLGSLRLDPEHHPVDDDSRWRLAAAGIRATLGSDLNHRRKVLFTGWFVAVASAPTVVARGLLRWLYVPQGRPGWVKRLGQVLRRGG